MGTQGNEKLNQIISRTDLSGNEKVQELKTFVEDRELKLRSRFISALSEVLPPFLYKNRWGSLCIGCHADADVTEVWEDYVEDIYEHLKYGENGNARK